MSHLNKKTMINNFALDTEDAKKRWLFSSGVTLFFLLAVFLLPFWSVNKFTASNTIVSDHAVSVVRVSKKMHVQNVEKAEVVPQKNEAPIIKKNQVIEQEEIPESVDEEVFSDETVDSEQTESAGEFSSEPVISEEIVQATTSYKSYALSRIASKKNYPISARSKGQEGKVRLELVINTDGKLSECRIITPCEYEALNEAALNAVKKASPFKKMNEGMTELKLSFVMDFSLK